MGLPIWRDPEENKLRRDAVKPDPTAAARSPIRRRPSVHGRRRDRTRLPRDTSLLPPRFERSPPPSVGFNGLRESRRTNFRNVPPVSTLLESADRRSTLPPPPPPPPVPETRNYEIQAERELRSSITQLQGRAARLEHEARAMDERFTLSPPPNFVEWDAVERRAWIEDNAARRASSPSRLRRHPEQSNLTLPGISEHTPFRRSPEPILSSNRPQPRDETIARRSNLPTPPHDVSEDAESLFLPNSSEGVRRRVNRVSHPLSHSWRPDSPVNGLGDRNRSPTPADHWEIMRTTIAPDESLPSAESSFTSAVATHSFASTTDTTITEPEVNSSSDNSRRNSADDTQSDSVSSVDPDDLECNDEEMEATAAFAEDMYCHELRSAEGQGRIASATAAHAREGNVFASIREPDEIEIGFRLINEALDSSEGRERVFQLRHNRPRDGRDFEHWIFAGRRSQRRPHITDDEPPSPHPERYGSSTHAAVREATDQVHDYFRRFTADALTAGPTAGVLSSRMTSPPPRYEPLASHPDVSAFSSREEPEAQPVSPPSARSERDVGDALLSGDEQDLNAVRRIVERLAQRDDVPDEWWMSMGLNLSRTRAGSRSPTRHAQSTSPAAGSRVRTGRIERNNSSRL